MKTRAAVVIIVLLATGLAPLPVVAQFWGHGGFSPEFRHDFAAAQKEINLVHNVDPYLALRARYREEHEQAELAFWIALAYNQTTGVVDYQQAVVHFTDALRRYRYPEKTVIQMLEWRGNSHEHLGHPDEALADYLRALLACSYHDLPEVSRKPAPLPGEPVSWNSTDPKEILRMEDYNRYLLALRHQEFLWEKRDYLVSRVRGICGLLEMDDAGIQELLRTLSPDSSRHAKIITWLKMKTKHTWP